MQSSSAAAAVPERRNPYFAHPPPKRLLATSKAKPEVKTEIKTKKEPKTEPKAKRDQKKKKKDPEEVSSPARVAGGSRNYTKEEPQEPPEDPGNVFINANVLDPEQQAELMRMGALVERWKDLQASTFFDYVAKPGCIHVIEKGKVKRLNLCTWEMEVPMMKNGTCVLVYVVNALGKGKSKSKETHTQDAWAEAATALTGARGQQPPLQGRTGSTGQPDSEPSGDLEAGDADRTVHLQEIEEEKRAIERRLQALQIREQELLGRPQPKRQQQQQQQQPQQQQQQQQSAKPGQESAQNRMRTSG